MPNGKPLAINSLDSYFGITFTKTLDAPLLIIGKDTWNRDQLAAAGITHMGAARMVTELAAELGARDLADLYKKLDVVTLAGTRGRGLSCLFVLWKAYESRGLSSVNWYLRGREGSIVTFLSIKRVEYLTERRTKKRKSGGRQEFKPTGKGKPL